jgi:hypothetical protein
VVVHPIFGKGSVFKYLGVRIDAKLSMVEEIHIIRTKVRPKLKAILRTRHLYSTADLIRRFKAHALPILEGSNGAICHAYGSHLKKLDVLQAYFVRELGISPEVAFLEHNLAPLNLRRDIGLLGLLFKIRFGCAHPAFSICFPPGEVHRTRTRAGQVLHNFQIQDFCDGTHNDWMSRSLFGFVRVFNRLPLHFFEGTISVSTFQHRLTEAARVACRAQSSAWSEIWTGRPFFS